MGFRSRLTAGDFKSLILKFYPFAHPQKLSHFWYPFQDRLEEQGQISVATLQEIIIGCIRQ